MSEGQPKFLDLLQRCIDSHASDMHLTGEQLPYVRTHGQLQPLGDDVISGVQMEDMARSVMNSRQREIFVRERQLDMAVTHQDGTVFRVNVYHERGKVAMALRRLTNEFRTFEQLHLPPELADLACLPHGLVLVSGATGSGKSTTLATLIHEINVSRAAHIITIEDPLEYIHTNKKSVVHQRELYSDVPSFAEAVRASLREDPDVILIGEMRDLDTMRAAITAAETGHLVFSTLHAGDAVGTLDRMIGVFPADEQASIRQQLSGVLRAVVAQRLVRERQGRRRVPCLEILRVNTAVANLIRRGEMQFIHTVMETGGADGMRMFDQSLAELVAQELIDHELALELAKDMNVFESRLRIAHSEMAATAAAARATSNQADSAKEKRGFWAFGRRD